MPIECIYSNKIVYLKNKKQYIIMNKVNNNDNNNIKQQKRSSSSSSSSSSSFYFKQRNIKLDLRLLTNIDIDRIIKDVDIDTLQSKLELLTFSDLNENDLKHYTDSNIIKLFRLSQLIIEYLLYSQDRLVID